jgi:hypothetical protein
MSTSILENKYIEADRPYSIKELLFNRDSVYKSMRIGKIRAHHKKCNHFYYVKENGRKEKEIMLANSEDVGNCSVCWKISKTPRRLKNIAMNLTDEYCNRFFVQPEVVSYEDVDLETTFIKWLYE